MEDAPAWLAYGAPGAAELIKWFGYWPSFHDAEVTSIELVRSGSSRVSVHAWEITREVDTEDFFVCHKHGVVNFLLEGIRELELADLNEQNVRGRTPMRGSPLP